MLRLGLRAALAAVALATTARAGIGTEQSCEARATTVDAMRLAGATAPEALSREGRLAEEALNWHLYTALARGSEAVCDGLRPFRYPHRTEGSKLGDWICRNNFHGLSFDRALIADAAGSAPRGPAELLKLCRKRMEYAEYPLLKGEAIEPACRAIIELRGKPRELCRRLEDWSGPFPECEATFAAMKGEESRCAELTSASWRESCRSYALFFSASKSRDASVCAGSELCRVLLGQGEAVATPYERRLAAWSCRRKASAAPTKGRKD